MSPKIPQRTAPDRTPRKPQPQQKEERLQILAQNRPAEHLYFLLERFEAGMELTGTEVKAIRAGKANLKDGYAAVREGELWLLNCHISPYEHGSYDNHEALRKRKLLLHKREIRKLTGKTVEKGLTLVPTKLYLKGGRIKCEIALAKGKKLWDRRETIRRKESDREARQAIKQRSH
jgi:SsrA-binding protein